MLKLLICSSLIAFVAACSDERAIEKETTAEFLAKGRAADVEASDGTIARIDDGREPTAIEPRSAVDLSDHPLSRYFIPEGYEALRYIGRFYNTCDKNHTAYTESNCNASVERGIRIGASVGIKVTRDDLVDPTYWKKMHEVHQMKRSASSDFLATLPPGNNLVKMDAWNKEFRERESALMADMSDK